MNAVTWEECCRLACQQLNIVGITQTVDWQVIKKWNISFQQHETFPHPNPVVALGKTQEPPIFQLYPVMKQLIRRFCLNNLIDLTIEKVLDYVKYVAIPECIKQDGEEMTTASFLHQCGLKKISQSTIYRWMKLLGFSYCNRRKTYYVDGHERDDVVKYRVEFCTWYLKAYEPCCLRWVQLPKSIASEYDELKCCGYTFTAADNIEMCEYHVDDLPEELASTYQHKMSV